MLALAERVFLMFGSIASRTISSCGWVGGVFVVEFVNSGSEGCKNATRLVDYPGASESAFAVSRVHGCNALVKVLCWEIIALQAFENYYYENDAMATKGLGASLIFYVLYPQLGKPGDLANYCTLGSFLIFCNPSRERQGDLSNYSVVHCKRTR